MRVVLIQRASPVRRAIAGVLAAEGHAVDLTDARSPGPTGGEFGAILWEEETLTPEWRRWLESRASSPGSPRLVRLAKAGDPSARAEDDDATHTLERPIDMEELRLLLRDRPDERGSGTGSDYG